MDNADVGNVSALKRRLADLLDKVLVGSENGYEVQRELEMIAGEWEAKEDPAASTLLARAQGLVGVVNVSPAGNPLADKAMQDLTAFKQELRASA